MGLPYVGPSAVNSNDIVTLGDVQNIVVSRGYDAIVVANGSDQSTEFQTKLDAIPEGGVLQFVGQVRIAKPIIGRRNKTIRGQAAPRWSYQTAPVTSIRPTAGFTGLAAILIPEATIVDSSLPAMATARSDYNDNGRLENVIVDASAISPGGDRGIYGIYLEGLVRNWQLTNVGTLSARGIGIGMSQGRGTANPRGIAAEHLQAVYSKGVGIYLAYTTDSHMIDLLAVSGDVDGQVHLGCAETQFEEVRSVFNKGRGVVLGGSRSIANAVHYGSISTDRNAFDGLAIEQGGTFPLFIDTAILNRDGSASTTADYAGVVLGDVATRIAPVTFGYLSVVPGVDDPAAAGQTGGGNYSPQHVIRLGNTTRTKIDTRMGWSADVPVLDKGNHSNTPYTQYDYLRSTTDGTVVVSQISRGDTGPANTLTIGTVSTGVAGSSAAASVTGTAPNQTLNLTIPTGAAGSTGNTGPANTLVIGTVSTGAAGSSASATITGSAPNQTLNLTIPTGPVGSNGSNGTNGVTYTTTSTSSTSQTVGTGSKTFTIVGVNGTPNYQINQLVRVYSSSTPQNYMQGLITATGTGTITVNATEIGGSGTITSWTIVPTGSPGTQIFVLAPGDADPTSASPAGFYFRRSS
jgi:hypothetical protein